MSERIDDAQNLWRRMTPNEKIEFSGWVVDHVRKPSTNKEFNALPWSVMHSDQPIFAGPTYQELAKDVAGMHQIIGHLLTKMGGKCDLTNEDIVKSAGDRWYVDTPKNSLDKTVRFRTYK